MTTPFDLFTKSLSFWTESTLKMQQAWAQALSEQADRMMSMSISMPLGNMLAPDEAQIREGFQKAADLNLNAWTQMAEKVSAMPGWAKAPVEVPGRTLADMFDMFRPFPIFDIHAENTPAPTGPPNSALSLVDDLTMIKGIGPKIAQKLETLGIVSFSQISGWTEQDIQLLDVEFSLGERITNQDWIGQAKTLEKRVLH